MKDAPGRYLIEWTGTDDDGRAMTFGAVINSCSIRHARKRCRELGARLVGRWVPPIRRRKGR